MNPVLRTGTASLLTVVLSWMSIMTGCKSAEPPPPQSQAAAPAQAAPAVAAAANKHRRSRRAHRSLP